MAFCLLLGEQAGETDVPTNGPPATSCPKPAFSISIGMGGESHKAVLGANARVRQVQSVVVFQKEFSRTDLVCRANADVWLGRGGAAILFDSEFASTAALRAASSSMKRRRRTHESARSRRQGP